jgi:hypothetical protein
MIIHEAPEKPTPKGNGIAHDAEAFCRSPGDLR